MFHLQESQEEPSDAEKAFDTQFKNWEEQFLKWKEQNSNHPDKVFNLFTLNVLFKTEISKIHHSWFMVPVFIDYDSHSLD